MQLAYGNKFLKSTIFTNCPSLGFADIVLRMGRAKLNGGLALHETQHETVAMKSRTFPVIVTRHFIIAKWLIAVIILWRILYGLHSSRERVTGEKTSS